MTDQLGNRMGLNKIRQMLAKMKTDESTRDFLSANLVSSP